MLAKSLLQVRCCLKSQPVSQQAVLVRLFHSSLQLDGYYVGNFPDPHSNLPRALQNKRKFVKKELEPAKMMEGHLREYDRAKRWLARMMGEDSETYTQEDVNRSIEYLLPSSLYAKDARPVINHPEEMYKNVLIDARKIDPNTDRPYEAAFFTSAPNFNNLTYKVWELLDELKTLEFAAPEDKLSQTEGVVSSPDDPSKITWLSYEQFKLKINERIWEKQYEELFNRFKRISSHPDATPEMRELVKEYQIAGHQADKHGHLDDTELVDGQARAMGYRKTATADVFLTHGTGKFTVNKQLYKNYFSNKYDLEALVHPFLIAGTISKFDVDAYVIGGGVSAQSGALRMGLSRAMATLSPELRPVLDEARLLERDTRHKERQKPGRKRARMRFAWRRR